MKLWILSDLHQDHGRLNLQPPPEADIAVIAGDVCNDQFLIDLAAHLPIVFVAGNHEFYGHAYRERAESLRKLPIHFLDDSAAIVGGVRFLGSTLWTDYGRNPVAAEAARRGMNDHRRIAWAKQPWERFLPSHATKLHVASRSFIEREVGKSGLPTVVVTHHAPSERSVNSRYASGPYSALNRAYYSDLDDLVAISNAALWIHGHVHTNFDYEIGNTRVLCNPRGYPLENPDWNPELVIEVTV